jgi:hypothetical protein
MARMLCRINDTGHLRRTVVEICKIDDDFLDSRVMIHQAKFRQGFEQTLEEAIEIIISKATSSEATTEMIPEITGQITGPGSRGLSCPLRI